MVWDREMGWGVGARGKGQGWWYAVLVIAGWVGGWGKGIVIITFQVLGVREVDACPEGKKNKRHESEIGNIPEPPPSPLFPLPPPKTLKTGE